MAAKPTLGEMVLGTQGLALLRLAFGDDAQARLDRIEEIRAILGDWDRTPAMSTALPASEYDLTAGYSRWSETYDQPLRLFPVEEPTMHRLLDHLPPSTILDAACGTGRHSTYLAARGHTIIGIDQSPAMLAKARVKLLEHVFREGDLEALPLDDHAVDHAICALAMVHLPKLDQAIAELARVVRPGGRVMISDVHPFLVLLGWQAQFRTSNAETGFMRLHPHLTSDYCAAFAAAGLRVRQCYEPRLTDQSAITHAIEKFPDANRAAWVGLPGVIIWDVERV